MYSDLGNQSQVYELELKLGETQQGENTITKYFNTLKGYGRILTCLVTMNGSVQSMEIITRRWWSQPEFSNSRLVSM